MWKGRFAQETAALVQQFGESISYDWRLYRHDIAGSIAHARAQVQAGLLTADEFTLIEKGLREIEADIDAGRFEFTIALEDIHMNIEAELTRRIGPAGAKLHTARSRNDQVATDTRLYCRAEADVLDAAIATLQRALLDRARKYATTVLPAYTHLQRGQPVTVGHHLLAYVEMLGRDRSRLADCRKRLNVSPLGSGALAGSTINLDRRAIAAELGFDAVTTNSMDAVADRDYIAELIFVIGLCGVHHVQNQSTLFQVRCAGRGQRQAAGAAGHQLGAQRGFQRRDVPRDHRARQVQLIGHGGEAAGFSHPHKELHSLVFVHCCLFCNK